MTSESSTRKFLTPEEADEVYQALKAAADCMPEELTGPQFSYMIYRLAAAYGLTPQQLTELAVNAAINIAEIPKPEDLN